nr:hypothetical protein [uncultured Holophaga sp.]
MNMTTATPFKNISPFALLTEAQPDSDLFKRSLRASNDHMIQLLANLWISEGFPVAFQQAPYRYDQIRIWVAESLGVSSKEITVVGSARLGFSLSPVKYGKAFNSSSDLDLAISNKMLFNKLKQEFTSFCDDIQNKNIIPRNRSETIIWPENALFISRNLPKNFIDIDKIPNTSRYPLSRQIKSEMAKLQILIQKQTDCPNVKKVSIRVYLDFKSFQSRLNTNLSDLRSKI